jgi:hypothetical protein
METKLSLPPTSGPLSSYCRHYALKIENGHRLVYGYLGLSELGKGCSRPVSIWPPERLPNPAILDGGCSIIHLVYDLDMDRVTSIFCNGVA